MLFFSVITFQNNFLLNLIFGFFQNILLCCKSCKMVTLTTNIVYKKSAQYRKYIWSFLSNLSKIKYLAVFITFCFVVSLAKMVTLTTNIIYKKSAQYRKYILSLPLNHIPLSKVLNSLIIF